MKTGGVFGAVWRTGALWAIAGAFFAGGVSAGTYTWSTTGTTGAAQDGSGTWDTTTANWVGAGNAHSVWSNANGDTAVFGVGGTAGTMTVDAGGITVGVLTLPNATDLEGATLLSDVSMDGSCDQLVGAGDLSLDGLKPHIADTGLLNTRKSYTLVTCSGTLSGSFAETHLPDAWHVRYDRTAGTVTIYYSPRGTLVKLM